MHCGYRSYPSYLKNLYILVVGVLVCIHVSVLASRFAVPIGATDLMIEGVVC